MENKIEQLPDKTNPLSMWHSAQISFRFIRPFYYKLMECTLWVVSERLTKRGTELVSILCVYKRKENLLQYISLGSVITMCALNLQQQYCYQLLASIYLLLMVWLLINLDAVESAANWDLVLHWDDSRMLPVSIFFVLYCSRVPFLSCLGYLCAVLKLCRFEAIRPWERERA